MNENPPQQRVPTRASFISRAASIALVLALLLSLANLGAQPAEALDPPVQVKDIQTGTGPIESSNPRYFLTIGSITYFTAWDPVHGRELWRTDGTPSGTFLIKDINPGALDSDPDQFAALNGILYFSATDQDHGRELWRSDGTEAGTRRVKDIYPGPPSGVSGTGSFVVYDDAVFFSGNDGSSGIELWRSDGTEAGTVLVKDINPGTTPSFPHPLTVYKDSLIFTAIGSGQGRELWKTDGTAAGTSIIKDINPNAGGSGVQNSPSFEILNGVLLFAANDGTTGTELWKTDGTAAGTELVKNINSGPTGTQPNSSSLPSLLTRVGSLVYFQANDGVNGTELWVTDGTEAGTQLAWDISPGNNGSFPYQLTSFNNALYFVSGTNLYKWDPASSTGTLLKTFTAFPALTGPSLTVHNNALYLAASDGTFGAELWKSNGTTEGTDRVADIYPGANGSEPGYLTSVGTRLFFAANDGVHGTELWRYDPGPGTIPGTATLIKNLAPDAGNANPGSLTAIGSRVFFTAYHEDTGTELWVSDGTETGTTLVKDIRPGAASSEPRELTVVNGILYFSADDGVSGRELWRSDGTAAGTYRVKDIYPGTNSSSPMYLTAVGDTLYFAASDSNTTGVELWRSDGTEAGTMLVKDINSGSGSSPRNLTAVGSLLYFTADDGLNGRELWKSDGTEAGTQLVRDLTSGEDDTSFDDWFAAIGSTLYFVAYVSDSNAGYELWKTDGTFLGTEIVKDIAPGTNSSVPSHLVPVGNQLFFFATTTNEGRELWKTDGTEAGTTLVKDIYVGPNSGIPGVPQIFGNQIVAANGRVYFVATDGTSGYQLWTSDGTEAGTRLVKEIRTEDDGGVPRQLAWIESEQRLLFAAYEPSTGVELWESDGTEAGTQRLADIAPGKASSNPSGFTAAGYSIFFQANDGTTGYELWRIALPEPTPTATTTPPVQPTPTSTPPGQPTATPPAGTTPTPIAPGEGDVFLPVIVVGTTD